ncbi:hypothetical protein H7097_01590 [Aeromicrobium sp.]|nr:hypothetical protein [Candidatus Saccharibacteria bacterium]
MKNILKAIAVTTVMVGMSSGVASAATTCNGTISNTGSGSANNITCTDENDNSVSCVNNVVVANENNQTATSGGAFTLDNTTGGDATTGDANNNNTVVVAVGVSCTPVAVATTTPTTPAATPVAPTTPQVLSEQVAVKPTGAVAAGEGAGVASNKVAATTGILASAGLLGFGLAIRKRVLGN